MVQQHILVADDREQIDMPLQPPGNSGGEGRVLEIRSVDEVVDRHQPVEVDRPVDLVQIVARQREMIQQEVGEVARAVVRGLDPHRFAVTSLCQLAFDRPQQVVDFFLVDEQVAVARHAKLIAAEHFHADEELGDERLDDRRQVDEVALPALARHADDARQGAWRLYDGEAGVAPEGVLALQPAR